MEPTEEPTLRRFVIRLRSTFYEENVVRVADLAAAQVLAERLTQVDCNDLPADLAPLVEESHQDSPWDSPWVVDSIEETTPDGEEVVPQP
jgi:uncharacterized protein (DUF2267 family)